MVVKLPQETKEGKANSWAAPGLAFHGEIEKTLLSKTRKRENPKSSKLEPSNVNSLSPLYMVVHLLLFLQNRRSKNVKIQGNKASLSKSRCIIETKPQWLAWILWLYIYIWSNHSTWKSQAFVEAVEIIYSVLLFLSLRRKRH